MDGGGAPKKKSRRRKKSGGTASGIQAPAPAEENPVVLREKPAGRGVRQGRLQDTLPDDPTMPVADFYKPSPLDSDVIMDATARLLAPRRSLLSSLLPKPEEKAQKQGKKKQAEPQKPKQARQEIGRAHV